MFQYLPLAIIISLNVMIYAMLKRQAASGPGWSIFMFFGILLDLCFTLLFFPSISKH